MRGVPNRIEDILANYEPVTESGCWIWLGEVDDKGYGKVAYRGKMWRVHRLFYEILRGPLPDQGDHVCEVKCCANPDHLVPATLRENLARAGRFKLTDEQVDEIRNSNEPAGRIAARFDISQGYVYNIRNNVYRPQTAETLQCLS